MGFTLMVALGREGATSIPGLIGITNGAHGFEASTGIGILVVPLVVSAVFVAAAAARSARS
ncbi:hypothetical protein [Austwickia chelonae]|uniref:hypothetical protein n=1 Tax=Austwickia chelonae TaxID=100225 RepID=UPI0013C306A8|nr:hypothetical protein [Austwickia chelonae]